MDYNEKHDEVFLSYFESGKSFYQAFMVLWKSNEYDTSLPLKRGRNILPMAFVLAHSIECYFKAYLALCGVLDIRKEKDNKGKRIDGHDLHFLHVAAEKHGFYSTDYAASEIKKHHPPPTDENINAHLEEVQKQFDERKAIILSLLEELRPLHSRETDFANRYLNLDQKSLPAHYKEDIFRYIPFFEQRNEEKYKEVTGKQLPPGVHYDLSSEPIQTGRNTPD